MCEENCGNVKGLLTGLIKSEKPFDPNTPLNQELTAIAAARNEKMNGFGTREYHPRRLCEHRNFQLKCGHNQDVAIKHYRTVAYKCNQCFLDDLYSTAKMRGLELVNMEIVKYSNERQYARPCGHIEIHSNSYLKKHPLSECQKCIFDEIKANLNGSDFEMISKARVGYTVQCRLCGEEQNSNTRSLRESLPTCANCFHNRLAREASLNGFTYLKNVPPKRIVSKVRTTLNRWYICNSCGYADNYGHIAMGMRNTRCDYCFTRQKEQEAENQGMVYLGHVVGGEHKYRLPCGCERDYPLISIRRGIWTCKVHGDTHYHRRSGVYLLEISDGELSWLKLGFAKNMDIRERGYGLPDGCLSTLLFYHETTTGYDALEIEKNIHSQVVEHRLSPVDMKKYMTNTGHTECYPLEIKELILDKLYDATKRGE